MPAHFQSQTVPVVRTRNPEFARDVARQLASLTGRCFAIQAEQGRRLHAIVPQAQDLPRRQQNAYTRLARELLAERYRQSQV